MSRIGGNQSVVQTFMVQTLMVSLTFQVVRFY